MELGGHAPVIVCADADPVKAARSARPGQDRQRRAGLHLAQPVPRPPQHLRPVHARPSPRPSPPSRSATAWSAGVQMGPMVNHRRLASVQKLIEDAVSRGATVTTGGKPIEGNGFFFQPTVLTDVPADAAILHEEPFGPVAPVAAFDDLDEALELANALPFGLAAYGYTDSPPPPRSSSRATRPASCRSTTAAARCRRPRPAASRRAATAAKAAPRASRATWSPSASRTSWRSIWCAVRGRRGRRARTGWWRTAWVPPVTGGPVRSYDKSNRRLPAATCRCCRPSSPRLSSAPGSTTRAARGAGGPAARGHGCPSVRRSATGRTAR